MHGISIILTYYNGSRFIEEQIMSLLCQTKPFCELLIFDDCSKDDEYEFLQLLINKINDERIKVIRNKTNLGYAKNFINGIRKANYDLIFLCDQDDIWDKFKLEKMEKCFEDKRINLLCSDIKPFYTTNSAPKWDKKNLSTMKNDGSIENILLSEENIHLQRSGSSMCFRRSFFNDIESFWHDGWGHDDFLWKFSVFQSSCSILHLNLTMRRLHDSNTSEIKVRTKQWRINEITSQIEDLSALKNGLRILNEGVDFSIINENLRGNEYRLKFLKGKNPFRWLKLFFQYKNVYPRLQGLYLDLYLFVFQSYRR